MTRSTPGPITLSGPIASVKPICSRRSGIPSAGSTPPPSPGRRAFRYGNGGRNTIEGPGVINLDVSLRRVLQVRDEETLEVRLEAFNSLNRANFNPRVRDGITQFGTPEFGVVGRALAGRQLQLALKYSF